MDDLSEALSAKDGQLAVLKIRLDEADQLLKSRSAALEEAQKEKSRSALVPLSNLKPDAAVTSSCFLSSLE